MQRKPGFVVSLCVCLFGLCASKSSAHEGSLFRASPLIDVSMTSRNFLTPDAGAFAEAATLNAPTAKLFPRSWSPHLDVFVMVTRIADRNHLVLHAMRDTAVWSLELDGPVPHPEITSVCWSPDGEHARRHILRHEPPLC